MTAPAPRQLADFEGRWRLERSIRHDDGTAARFEGMAAWTRQGADLAYLEAGTLHLNGQAVQAERRYLWKPDLTVWFADGRFFHRVPALGGETAHWCDPDQYDGWYDFGGWPAFRVGWTVRGPRKSYEMSSEYRPAG